MYTSAPGVYGLLHFVHVCPNRTMHRFVTFREHRKYGHRPAKNASLVASKGQPRSISRPPVQSQNFSPAQLLLAKILHHPASDLSKGGAHHLAEVPLDTLSARGLCKLPKQESLLT